MTTKPRPVPFGEWLPDIPPIENSGALVAKNCIPQIKSYRSLGSLATFTSPLVNPALGAFWLQNASNAIFNFAGDSTALYRLISDDTVWSDVSQAPYVAANNWEFAKFGERVIAVDINNAPQFYDTSVPTLFADLEDTPPKASRVAVVRDFVVLGDTIGSILGTDSGPNFVQWCAFNDSSRWTPDRATQSDRQELFGRGGKVQKIVPGEYGVIVQEHSIHRMDYIGPPAIFQFDEVERGRGTPAPNSVIWTGNLVFYYGHDGFYLFNGTSSEPIGANRVNQWFKETADITGITSMRGVIDRRNRLAMWAFKSSSALDNNDMIIIFNWTANRWSYAEIDTQILAEYVTSGFTLDDVAFNTLYNDDVDGANQTTFDSVAYLGGALSLQAFDVNNQSATFNGTPLMATIDTTELIGANNGRMYINSIRPIINGAPETVITVEIGSRNKAQDNVTYTVARGLNAIGEANIRKNTRYQRYRVNIAGGFTHANGVQSMVRDNAGRR